MAKEFSIPGLKEATQELQKFSDNTNKLSKDLLNAAINAEKVTSAYKNTSGLKDYVKAQETTIDSSKKIEQAKKRLIAAQDEEAKELAKINLMIQQANKSNRDYAKSIDENATALDKLNFKIAQTTKESKELGAQMVLMASEGKKNTKEYKDLEKAFLEASKTSKQLNDSYREISKTAGDNRALVGSYSDELKGHFDMINGSILSLKGNIASGNFAGAFNDARTIVQGFGNAVKTGTDAAQGMNDSLIRTGTQAIKSADELRASVMNNVKAYLGFRTAAQQVVEVQEAQTAATETNIAITEVDTIATEVNTGATEANIVVTETATAANKGFTVSEIATTAATWLLTAAVYALILPVVAVVAAGAALVSYFASFQPLMDSIAQKFAGLTAAFDVFQQAVVDGIKGITSIGDAMSKLGNIIAHPIDSFKELGKEMSNAADQAERLKKSQQDLEDDMDVQAIKNREAENQIGRLMLQAKNRSTSEKERMELLEQASNIEKANYKERNDLATREKDQAIANLQIKKALTKEEVEMLRKGHADAVQLLKDKQDAGIFNIEDKDIKKYTDAINKKQDLIQDSQRIQETITNRNDALAEKADKKAEEDSKKELERRTKSLELLINTKKTALDYIIATYKQEEHTQDENLAHTKSIALEKESIAKLQLQKDLVGISNGSLDYKNIVQKNADEIAKIKLEAQQVNEKILIDGVNFELELYDVRNKTLLKEGAKITDLLIGQEKKRLDKEYEMYKKALDDITGLDEAKVKQKEKEHKQLTANEFKYLKDLNNLENKRDNEQAKADKLLLDTKKKDAEEQKKIDDEVQAHKEKGANDALNNIAVIAGKETELGKAAAIAQIGITTQKAAMEAYANGVAYGGPLGEILGPLYAGLAIAAGAESAANVAGIQMFAEGTDFAPYTGKAIVDEIGAEIHMDKNGKIKSFGSEGGARLTDIVQGDRIIPADISAMIRQTIFSGSMFQHEVKSQTIDYAEMGKYFDKSVDKSASKIVSAIQKKKESNFSVNIAPNNMDRVTFKGKRV